MTLFRAAGVAAFMFLCALPIGARAQTPAGTITGTVSDASGAPVAGAQVLLIPPRAASTKTDARGRFSFRDVPQAAYSITVVKGGFVDQTIAGVRPGSAPVGIVLTAATLSTLRQIAAVHSVAGTFNDSATAVRDLPRTRFLDAGQIQVGHIFDQIPGVVSARPGSGNAAVPGSITSPNLRGALDYEKATLLDGHPLINGRFGDYPTMLVNSMLFDNIEVVEGPTAYAPEINYGIGGTLNFRTGEPGSRPGTDLIYGVDNQAGSFANLRYSGSALGGKLRFLFNGVTYGTQGPLPNYRANFVVPAGTVIDGYGAVTAPTASSGPPRPGVVGTSPVQNVSLVACCQLVNSDFLNRGEVAKLQYRFSPATSLTAGFVGIQALYDGPAGNFTQNDSLFTPDATFTPSALKPGAFVLTSTRATLPDQRVYDNEPMFEAELRTTLDRDTILGRFYTAVLDRQTTSLGLSDPTANYVTAPISLYGTAQINGATTSFNGAQAALTIPVPYANSVEHDALRGTSFEYDHPIADNVYTFAFDRYTSLTNAYSLSGNPREPSAPIASTSIAAGTRQDFSTYLLRGTLALGPRVQLTLANYFNVYQNRYTPQKTNGNFVFANSTSTHDDPRLGVAYHPSTDFSLRFSAGSAIAPPYPQLLDNLNTTAAAVYAQNPNPTAPITISQNSGTIKPETSFGYDLGADWRTPRGTLSVDAYLTNLHNQFVGVIYPSGTTYTPPGGKPLPVYVSTNANLSQSRYEGIDGTFAFDPPIGVGYTFSLALQRAYAYNLPPGFYTSAAGPYTTNLGVLNGTNFVGFNAPFFNGISNKSEAYSQGYAGVHLRGRYGQYAELGFTLYGANNTFNIPAMLIGTATYRQPIGHELAVQLSADNIFSSDSAPYVLYGGGIPAPLANGSVGLRSQVPYGPATLRLMLMQKF